MDAKQEVDDIIRTCQSIEELRYIKVRSIRVNEWLWTRLYRGDSLRCDVPVKEIPGKSIALSMKIWAGVTVPVYRHKMKTPWMLVVTPVNNKDDRVYR